MFARINPFRPGQIVSPGMFAGRIDEIQVLDRALVQTRAGNPLHFAIRGERGIGKSSLLYLLQEVARGNITSIYDGPTFKFIYVGIDLEPATTYHQLVRRVGSEFNRQVRGFEPARHLLKSGFDFLARWELGGVKYSKDADQVDPSEMLDDLVHTITQAMTRLDACTDGIVIAVDEADKPNDANLGEFCKLMTERLTKKGCPRVLLGLSGLPHLTQRLRDSHESAPRVFEDLYLKPLERDECKDVIRRALSISEKEGGQKTTIEENAEEFLAGSSEGFPHFIQQFGYCAFEADTDGVIDVRDVANGIYGANGGLYQLGVKYFSELYFDKIGSDEYRKVLQEMAKVGTAWITKKEIRAATGLKETTLTNALAALKTRNIILTKDGQAGTYRLPTQSFASWIRVFIKAPEELAGTSTALTSKLFSAHEITGTHRSSKDQ
ncbi:MAG: AAA family ATPase [Phycisphaerales bacterium]